jgi:predicted DCC family thiol-disulfide oxidoreductase YuxK
MKTLTIFYDPHCGLCARFRVWLEQQPARVRVEFLAYDSAEAARRFPGLPALGADREVVVLADDGRWWQGAAAWITCLWATHAYQEWAFRLAAPGLLPFVRKTVHLLSENRLSLSRLLRLRGDTVLAHSLGALPEAACHEGTCALPRHNPSISCPQSSSS